jgi:hypothetical protein
MQELRTIGDDLHDLLVRSAVRGRDLEVAANSISAGRGDFDEPVVELATTEVGWWLSEPALTRMKIAIRVDAGRLIDGPHHPLRDQFHALSSSTVG